MAGEWSLKPCRGLTSVIISDVENCDLFSLPIKDMDCHDRTAEVPAPKLKGIGQRSVRRAKRDSLQVVCHRGGYSETVCQLQSIFALLIQILGFDEFSKLFVFAD